MSRDSRLLPASSFRLPYQLYFPLQCQTHPCRHRQYHFHSITALAQCARTTSQVHTDLALNTRMYVFLTRMEINQGPGSTPSLRAGHVKQPLSRYQRRRGKQPARVPRYTCPPPSHRGTLQLACWRAPPFPGRV